MKRVNPYFLLELLNPLAGLADDDDAVMRYQHVNPNDELEIRTIIREALVPHFRQLPPALQESAQTGLRFYLSKPEANFARVFEGCLPPFDPPDDARLFFMWLWDELFPGESFLIGNMQDYQEAPDIHELNRLCMPPPSPDHLHAAQLRHHPDLE